MRQNPNTNQIMNTMQNNSSAMSIQSIAALLEPLHNSNGPLSPEALRAAVRAYGPEGVRAFTRVFWHAVESGLIIANLVSQEGYRPTFTRFWRMRGLPVAASYGITEFGRIAYLNARNPQQPSAREHPSSPDSTGLGAAA